MNWEQNLLEAWKDYEIALHKVMMVSHKIPDSEPSGLIINVLIHNILIASLEFTNYMTGGVSPIKLSKPSH